MNVKDQLRSEDGLWVRLPISPSDLAMLAKSLFEYGYLDDNMTPLYRFGEMLDDEGKYLDPLFPFDRVQLTDRQEGVLRVYAGYEFVVARERNRRSVSETKVYLTFFDVLEAIVEGDVMNRLVPEFKIGDPYRFEMSNSHWFAVNPEHAGTYVEDDEDDDDLMSFSGLGDEETRETIDELTEGKHEHGSATRYIKATLPKSTKLFVRAPPGAKKQRAPRTDAVMEAAELNSKMRSVKDVKFAFDDENVLYVADD